MVAGLVYVINFTSWTLDGIHTYIVGKACTKPRSLRFTWSMKTTSMMDPTDILQEIERVLNINHCDYDHREKFMLMCAFEAKEGHQLIQWEMEVCKLPRLQVNGVRFKRISGNTMAFKGIASKIANELKL